MKKFAQFVVLISGFCLLSPVAGGQEPPPPGEPPLPSEQETLAFLETNLPEVFENLQRLRQNEPEIFQHEIRMLGHMVRRYNELKRVAPELAAGFLRAQQLDAQCRKVAEALRQAPDEAQKTALKQKLEEMLNEIFDLRLAERELEVKNLERELNKIRTMLETRREAKGQIVERRLRDLTMEVDEAMGWW
ncbi:MAG TPA: hypothetical protein P5567_11695 [Kiritimatiellia bacterium]|nr:hypothetical protein [Kiritimatiellia bacterium]HRZ13103.1 hypothetical protein [Kiritimatiellia bacterium]HSA17524.1 hypothetical protein [Kiritimatiellia bacterium]